MTMSTNKTPNAMALMQLIIRLDSDGKSPMDADMLGAFGSLISELPAIVRALDNASVAGAAMENMLLTPGVRAAMTDGDRHGRDQITDELRASLDVLGA